jgi:inner membrane protein
MPLRFWVLSIACSLLPDLDVIGFRFGVRYGDLIGHRGLAHSLPFAVIVGFILVLSAFPNVRRLSRRWWGLWAYFFAVTASHGMLDAMTDGGLGIAFFSPLDTTRYFLPWRPLTVAPVGLSPFMSEWGKQVVISEILWLGTPLVLLLGIVRAGRAVANQKQC